MKKILPYILVIFSTITTHAQSWQWGTPGTSAPGWCSVEGYAVATDAAGNSYGAGTNWGSSAITFGGTVTIPYSWITTGGQALWAKFDPLGSVLWAGGTQGGNAVVEDIAADTAGNLIVFGYFSDSIQIGSITLATPGPGLPYAQYFLAKFNPSGTLLWAIKDGKGAGYGNVTSDAAGNIYITSIFIDNTMTIGPYILTNAVSTGTSSDIFVAKYTPSGTVVWASSIGGSGDDHPMDIAVTTTGYVYISGQTQSPFFTVGSSVCSCPPGAVTSGVALIAKFSPTGVPVWGQVAGGHPGRAEGIGLAADTAGNVYMAGTFTDTTIFFGTTTLTKPSLGSLNAGFIVRYTPADTVDWSKVIGSAGDILPYSVAISRCGWVWVSGSYTSDAYIGRDTLMLAAGMDPTFIVGYNTTRPLVEYTGIGSGGDDLNRIACDKDGNVFLCSDYMMAGLIFGHDTLPYTGGEPFFIAKYSPAIPCCLASTGGPAVTITSSYGDTVCPDSMVTFTATHSSAGATPSYQWMVNGHPAGRDTAAYSYIPTAGDSVYCIISSSEPCASPDTAHSNVIHISFLSFEYPGISIIANPDTVCAGDTVTFHSFASSGGPAPGYQWKKNGINAGTGSTYSYVPAAGDTIWCVLTSSYPCLMSRTAMSNKMSVVVQDCKAGIASLSPDAIQIAPNPAGSEFTIHLYASLPQGSRADLVDVTGRIVSSQPLSGRSAVISVRNLTAGIYLCRIISANGQTITKKIAVVR